MTTPIRIAVVGAGRLGTFHARLAAQNDAFDLVAVADPFAEPREKLAAEVDTQAIADPSELLGKIDAAIVATPTVTHHAISKPLLEAGVHTLIEKPITATTSEAEDLVSTADAHNAVLQVGHVERFNPAMNVVNQQGNNPLRDPRYIQASRTSGYTFRSTDIGAVLDLMIHDIDLVLSIADSQVTNVSAIGVSVLGDHEDIATAQLTFASGCVAQVTASRVSYEPQRSMQVFTTRGFTSLDFATGTATTISPREDVLQRNFSVADLTAEQTDELRSGLFEKLLVKQTSEAPAVNAIDEEQQDFANAILMGATPRVSGAAGRDAVVIANRVLEQIDQHQWDGDASGRVGMFPPTALPAMRADQIGPVSTPLRKAG